MIKHMNAIALKGKKYKEVINNPNYIIEEKLKGIRAFVQFGKYKNIITSRGGHDISHRFPHIRDYSIPNLEHVILDGELYQPGIEDEIIAGWGNVNTKHIDPDITHNIKLYAFDNPSTRVQIMRKNDLSSIFYNIPKDAPFIEVPYSTAVGINAEIYYTTVLAAGGEGIMLKHKFADYTSGKRLSNNWYKLKGSETFDVVITGFEWAETWSVKKGDVSSTPTKFAGMIGAFKYGMYVPCSLGKFRPGTLENIKLIELGTCSGMDDKTRYDMTINEEFWLGQVVEIEGVEQKESGAIDHPRYKRIRPDKRAEECIWIKE